MERTFIFVFSLAVLLFCVVVIGIFLVLVKIALLFWPDIYIMGIHLLSA